VNKMLFGRKKEEKIGLKEPKRVENKKYFIKLEKDNHLE